jgi:hypothetical protein
MQGLKRFSWGPVLYPRELLLPQLERVLEATIEKVQTESPRRAAQLHSGGYVQILNLAYVCNASNGAKGLRHWRQLMAEQKLQDDAPTHKGMARFVVCGWGAGKLSAAESQRVAANVVSWTSPAGYLVTPRRGDSSIPIEVDCVRLARLNVTELAHTLRNPNCYPCGGRNRERETFKSLYPAAVSEVLAAILLGENPATVPR